MYSSCCYQLNTDMTHLSIFAQGQPANIDSRLADDSEEKLVACLRSLPLTDTDLPTRPGHGTMGQPIKLRTNFFPVEVPEEPIYEYVVLISPPGKHYDSREISGLSTVSSNNSSCAKTHFPSSRRD